MESKYLYKKNYISKHNLIIYSIFAFFLLEMSVVSAQDIFIDNFDDLSLAKWDRFGSPSSYVLGLAEGRSGIFNNNGDSMYDSGAITKETFSLQNGFTLESDIFLKITARSASYALVDFGLTDKQEPDQLEYGIEWFPNKHAYLRGHFLTENGNHENYGFWDEDDAYINGWHNWKVVVGADRYVKFYLDGNLIYSSQNRIDTSVLEGKKLSISGRSYDGKAYNDFIYLNQVDSNLLASIGDLVWNDADKDGIQDPGENGIEGVIVNLYKSGETVSLKSTKTDKSGKYLFANLEPGSYQIEFMLPERYTFSPKDQGLEDDTIDSDVDPDTGRTIDIYLSANEEVLIQDAGMIFSPSSKKIITFSGIKWAVTDTGPERRGPSNNYWTEDNVRVDMEGRLHLNITQLNGKWYCAEVQALDSFGYGEYTFHTTLIKGNLGKQVLGMCNYRDDDHEIDIEITKAFPSYFGDLNCWNPIFDLTGCSDFAVKPDSCQSVYKFSCPELVANDPEKSQSTHKFIWNATGISFESHWGGTNWPIDTSNIISFWSYTHNNLDGNNPLPYGLKPIINLWVYNGNGPFKFNNPVETEVIIDKFEFHELKPLRNLAGDFLIGYASRNNFWNMPDTATYTKIAEREFNILTPENQMKFDAIHPDRNVFNFGPAEYHVIFAMTRNMKVHGHNLIWGDQLPEWVGDESQWDRSNLLGMMSYHIENVAGHFNEGNFKGQISIWDVVNEAFDEAGNYKKSIWHNVIGDDYIEEAFKNARKADPGAKLIYNDYNIETENPKSQKVYDMVKDFKNRGIPIDGVGIQMHRILSDFDDDFYESFARNMKRFADLGVEVFISEMSISISSHPTSLELFGQALVYRNILDLCLSQHACKGLQIWGLTDKYSWPEQRNPTILDQDYNPKWAYYALQSELSSNSRVMWLNGNLRSHSDLHLYDPLGRHVGKNYSTGTIDLEIPGAVFTNNGTQSIDIGGLQAGNYRITLVGTSCGIFELNILGGLGEEILINKTYSDKICDGLIYNVTVNVTMLPNLTFHISLPEQRAMGVELEELLRSQTSLIGSFENLLKNTTLNSTMSYKFLDSFDNLADLQQRGLSSFEDLVSHNWSDLEENEKISLTESFEDLLRRQAIILTSNEDLLKRGFCKLATDDKKELLDRFEARLKSEADLLRKFEDWQHYQQLIEETEYETWIAFLASFEDLIRRQSNLLDSFEMLMKLDCTDEYINITKSADPLHVQGGSDITYTYTVTATNASFDVKNIVVKDSLWGEVGTIALLKYSTPQTLTVTKPLSCADCNNCECKVCNFANACGEVITPNGNFTVCDVSNDICVEVDENLGATQIYPG